MWHVHVDITPQPVVERLHVEIFFAPHDLSKCMYIHVHVCSNPHIFNLHVYTCIFLHSLCSTSLSSVQLYCSSSHLPCPTRSSPTTTACSFWWSCADCLHSWWPVNASTLTHREPYRLVLCGIVQHTHKETREGKDGESQYCHMMVDATPLSVLLHD